MDRRAALERLGAGETFDLLVIGGGAAGLGTALDAAARGLRTALVERGDFAVGTSSRSTKLIHGGVRYLRQGNVSLVLEGLRERGRLLRNAPHLVRELAFAIPCYGRGERLFYAAGLKLYDLLAGSQGLAPSRALSARELSREIATVASAGLRGGVRFQDGQFDDARLALTLARTAEKLGCALANYAPAVGLIKERGRIVGALVRDPDRGRDLRVSARRVVNATGVFVDAVRQWDEAGAEPLVAVSQGAHLVVPRRFLPGNTALVVPRTRDGRLLFAVPWHDRVVLGTTDTPLPAARAEPRALAAEREFILEHAARYLSEAPVERDVLSVFAGLRPLVRPPRNVASTAALSREHAIVTSSAGLITVTGGKWTTYRQMAEDVVDRVVAAGEGERLRCRTRDLALHGSDLGYRPASDAPAHFTVYGSDAALIGEIARAEPALCQRLHPRLPYTAAEVVWHARGEMARTVEDVLARRTRALLLDARASIEAAPAVAALLARELGREFSWQAEEVRRYGDLARGYVFSDPASMEPAP